MRIVLISLLVHVDVALQDYTKYVADFSPVLLLGTDFLYRRWKVRMNPPEAEAETPSPHLPVGPKKDYSLKDGQTFSITIPGKAKNVQSNAVSNLFGSGSSNPDQGGGSGGAFPLLPPPPGR